MARVIFAVATSKSYGLAIVPAPQRFSNTASCPTLPLASITGTLGRFSKIHLLSPNPSISPGIRTSLNTKSIRQPGSSRIAIASAAQQASRTEKPLSPRWAARAMRIKCSSSTTNTTRRCGGRSLIVLKFAKHSPRRSGAFVNNGHCPCSVPRQDQGYTPRY